MRCTGAPCTASALPQTSLAAEPRLPPCLQGNTLYLTVHKRLTTSAALPVHPLAAQGNTLYLTVRQRLTTCLIPAALPEH